MRFLRDFWPTILVVAVILYATLAADPMGADQLPRIPGLDKLIHAIMMGGLVAAIAFDMQRRKRSISILTPQLMWTIFACVMMFCVLDEVTQALMPNRRAYESWDLVADAVGAIVAVFTAPPAIRRVLRIQRSAQ